MSTGLVGIYKVKRSQRHLLAAIENNRLGAPIVFNNGLFQRLKDGAESVLLKKCPQDVLRLTAYSALSAPSFSHFSK